MADTPAAACDATVLSNGRYRVLLSTAGSGVSALGDDVITRWTADRTRDADGFFLYVRDLERNVVWSAGLQPVRRTPDRYATRFEGGLAVIERRDEAIETSTTVAVARDQDIECRRVTLRNLDLRPRRLELTTYVEAVLATPWADAGHPAFGKLFVETEWAPDPGALLAHRRPRSLDEAPIWVAHALVLEDPVSRAHPCTFETDRARFIGRGRSLAAPAALEPSTRLSGTVGSVLDPVLAIRQAVVLEPGQSVALLALLTAGPSREDVLGAIAGGAVSGAADRLFARPAQAAPSERARIAWLWDRDGQVPVPRA
ncbi:MAG: hypothetical protein Q7J79_12005, partial [Gemmatimonadales bacterium]|nr:hypothetical protein [Gemmatimonadales bacterium]